MLSQSSISHVYELPFGKKLKIVLGYKKSPPQHNKMSYANAKFIIYRKIHTPNSSAQGILDGSLLIGFSMNEEEATRKVNILKQSYDEFNKQFPSRSKTEYCYIANNPAWWKPVYG